ncbi:hypothetical protein JCM11641_003859 [Rhodosporidiobolus odoratus]
MSYDSSKRRRTTTQNGSHSLTTHQQLTQPDLDWTPTLPQPTTARAKANAHREQQYYQQQQQQLHPQQQQQQQQQQQYQQQYEATQRTPILSLASFPPAALQRYLSRYGLLPPSTSLSYYHAVFPVPLLPAHLAPPLDRENRTLNYRTAKRTYVPARRNAKLASASDSAGEEQQAVEEGREGSSGAPGPAGGAGQGKKRKWVEPKTEEFRGLTGFDGRDKVLGRLAGRATAHWEKRDTIKEAETLTNFMFSCRFRAAVLLSDVGV